MARVWMLAVLVASACGGGSKEEDRPPSCRSAVNKMGDRLDYRDSKIDRAIRACEREEWSAEMRRCVAGVEEREDLERCERKERKRRREDDDDKPDDELDVQMEHIADEMCECKSMECAQRVMDRAVKLSEKHAGKDVASRSAARYEKEQKRIVTCMRDIAKRDAPPPVPPRAVDEPRPPTRADLHEYTRGIRGYGKLRTTIETSEGSFHCELYEDKAPMTVANFVGLATGKKPWRNPRTSVIERYRPLYEGVIFHRVIPGFMIQTGDPLGTGTGGPGYRFDDEVRNGLQMEAGMLAMANSGPATNGSQFFIMEARAAWLDDKHTIFGRCDEVDLVKKIANVPRSRGDKPDADVTIRRITFERR